MDLVSVGGATIDVFVMLHKLQKFSYDKFSNQISFPLGEKVPLDEYKMALGGNACNVAVGLSRLGLQTTLAAEIGTDEFADKITAVLSNEKVNLDLITKNAERNSHFNIVLSFEGERTILEEKTPESQMLVSGNLNPKLIYLTSTAGNFKKFYDEAIANNPDSKLALNPGTRQISQAREVVLEYLSKIEMLFVNVQEAQLLANDSSPDIKKVLNKLKDMGTKIVVATDGRSGSYAIDKDGQTYKIETATSNKPVERTGAGDAYATGFVYANSKGLEIAECMKYGAINADSVIEQIGSQDGLLTKDEIEKKLHDNNLNAFKI